TDVFSENVRMDARANLRHCHDLLPSAASPTASCARLRPSCKTCSAPTERNSIAAALGTAAILIGCGAEFSTAQPPETPSRHKGQTGGRLRARSADFSYPGCCSRSWRKAHTRLTTAAATIAEILLVISFSIDIALPPFGATERDRSTCIRPR